MGFEHTACGHEVIAGPAQCAGLIWRKPGMARSIAVLVDPEHLPVLRPSQPVKTSEPRI
jgi:hypothetical protein